MIVGGAAARNVATATAGSACTARTRIDLLAAATAATASPFGLTTSEAVRCHRYRGTVRVTKASSRAAAWLVLLTAATATAVWRVRPANAAILGGSAPHAKALASGKPRRHRPRHLPPFEGGLAKWVSLPAISSAGTLYITSRLAIPDDAESTSSTLAASALASGTLRRVQTRQPPPRRGGLTEQVNLPAGPLAGAAAATSISTVRGSVSTK
jgi:hypothetical protein